ncbi:TipA [Balamuthia mandrillaris]
MKSNHKDNKDLHRHHHHHGHNDKDHHRKDKMELDKGSKSHNHRRKDKEKERNGSRSRGKSKDEERRRRKTKTASPSSPALLPLQVDWARELPNYPVASLPEKAPVVWEMESEGGEQDFVVEGLGGGASCACTSTYPTLPNGEKDGDPIADYPMMLCYSNRVVVALADGCNWGIRSAQAARSAILAFKQYLHQRQGDVATLRDAARLLQRAFFEANRKIMEGKESAWEAGTTTLLGGLLLQFKAEEEEEEGGGHDSTTESRPSWGFLCCNVGDCKAYHFSMADKSITDITDNNRVNISDARDPGGRLGPYLDEGLPDLRNFKLYFLPCAPQDLLLIVSDGKVHDNFDPRMLGKMPRDIGIAADQWDLSYSDVEAERAKNKYRNAVLKRLLCKRSESLAPAHITKTLIEYCFEATQVCREWMEQHPNQRQPDDYQQFPGKMDHTTCICFVVGRMVNEEEEGEEEESSSDSS